MLLRTEEVHDVSGTPRPVVALLEIDVQHVDGLRVSGCDGVSLDPDPHRLPAGVAFRNDRNVLPEVDCASQGVDGAHGVKSSSVREADLVVGRPCAHGVRKCYSVVFFDDNLFEDQGLQDPFRSGSIHLCFQKRDHVADGNGSTGRQDASLECEAKAALILVQAGNNALEMEIFKGEIFFAGCH